VWGECAFRERQSNNGVVGEGRGNREEEGAVMELLVVLNAVARVLSFVCFIGVRL
jgi:hypothetical protein